MDRRRAVAAAPYLLLAAAVALSLAALLSLGSGLTFFQDTWAYLMNRRGTSADVFLEPHNEHLVVIPVAIEKLLVEAFGMTSALPEYILLDAMLVATALLLFAYVRRRLGPWPALLAAVLVLFLGPAWDVLLWPFEIALVGSTMAGIAVLLALEREDRRGDLAACLLVALSIGFSSLGVAFAVAALVDVLQRRRTLGLGRLYVPAVGLGLYTVWYLAYGREAKSFLSAHNVLHSPVFVAEGVSASVGALSGLSVLGGDPTGRPYLGFAALLALAALAAWKLPRWPGLSSRLWPVVAAGGTFWVLAAFNRSPGREAMASRYMHFGAILVLLAAADLLKGVRFGARALLVAAALVLAVTAVNFQELEKGSDRLHDQTVLTRAGLGAMEIARGTISPRFRLYPDVAGTPSLIDVEAASYFPVAREHGTPAYSPAELARAPAEGRRQADVVLARALPISVAARPGLSATRLGARKGCLRGGGGGAGREVELSAGVTRVEVSAGPPARLYLRRFAAGEYPVPVSTAPGRSTAVLRIPADRASRPWHLFVEATQPFRVCPMGSA
jgi:hypothetical protein